MERYTSQEDVKLRSGEIRTAGEGHFLICEKKAFIAVLTAKIDEQFIGPDGSFGGTDEDRLARQRAIALRYYEQMELSYVVRRTQELERLEKKPTCEVDHIISEARKTQFSMYDYVKYLSDENIKLVLTIDDKDRMIADIKAKLADVTNELDAERRRRRC